MTGSFLFVKPSDPDGKPGTAYSDKDKPPYQCDRASWEWLLERALRRALIPWALTESHSRALLYGHEDQYSMHMWGSYGNSDRAGVTPVEYESVGGPGSSKRKTDADLSPDDRNTPLPDSWGSGAGAPTYSPGTKVAYGMADLEEAVARLPFSLEWLHPDWSAADLDAWDLTASTTETTQGSAPTSPDGFNWTWETTVKHVPYEIPDKSPFKCLSHMRTDDPTVTAGITNDDGKAIEVETAPTPLAAPRTEDGSVRDYHGTKVRVASYGAAYRAGWALSEFFITHRYGLDYGPSTGPTDYYRDDGKTAESFSTLGCLVDIPDKDSGNIVVVSSGGKHEWAGFAPDVDWGGKQTWWHEKGFPKGLDSVLSPKLKAQLEALCPKCQPAIPPAVPAFRVKFPDAGRLPFDYQAWYWFPYSMLVQDWMRHLTLACTPFDMSARLDAMTTTVHRVPVLFAKMRTVTTTCATERTDRTDTYSDGPGSQSWSLYTTRRVITVEGTSKNPIPAGAASTSVSGERSSVTCFHGTDSHESASGPASCHSWNVRTRHEWEESFKSDIDFLVCLRSTSNTEMSTMTTTETSKTHESSSGDPSSSETYTPDGKFPDSFNPDPDDLLFPDWALPWIETAELFASIESRLIRHGGADSATTEYSYGPVGGTATFSYAGSGSGKRTHKARRKIVSLGVMDASTGRFPAVDAAAVLSEADPDPTEPVGGTAYDSADTTYESTTDADRNQTERTVTVTKGVASANRSRSVSYYVAVRWKFDRTDPETLKTALPLAGLYRKLADAKRALSDKRREISDAEAALESAKSDLESAKSALELAEERLAKPGDAEPGLLAEAQAALDKANRALSDAQSEKSDAQSEYAVAESGMRSAESALKTAQESYDAAVGSGEGVEEARAALESAYAAYFAAAEAYGEASGRLSDATAGETVARLAADAAQAYLDTLHDKVSEILQKDVDAAQAAVDEATSRADKWKEKAESAKSEIPGLEAAVKAAEQAIRDAAAAPPNSSRTSRAGT